MLKTAWVIHIRQNEPREIINTVELVVFIGPLMRGPCRAITLEETQFVSVRLSSGRLEERTVQGINVQGVSDGLVSLLFPSSHGTVARKKERGRTKPSED